MIFVLPHKGAGEQSSGKCSSGPSLADAAATTQCLAGSAESGTGTGSACIAGVTDEFELRLAWRGDSVLVHISRHGDVGQGADRLATDTESAFDQAEDSAQTLAIDISAVGKSPLLKAKDTRIEVDGPWKKICGVSASFMGQAALVKALADPGILCAVSVRDACGKTPPMMSAGAHALHLDATVLYHGS